jgi:hypothetical protein
MTNPDELERAVERLEADMTACGKSWLVAVHKADLRLILAANREMREEIEVAAVHLQLAGGWLREAGDDGQRANTLLNASNHARSALSTKED